jgi:glycosyltransferase involved in cell wall biosynthesis
MAELDIVIPVYNEGASIVATLRAIERDVTTPARVLICYDFDEDDTLAAIAAEPDLALDIAFVKNRARGPHAAVMTGMAAGTAPYVLVFPADDDYNSGMLDQMVARAREGHDIVCASRFIPGGAMVGCPPLKAAMVRGAAFTLYWLAGVPTRDATNGFRLFSRAFLDRVAIESHEGFTYSLELLVKCHRLGGRVAEVPARWFERKAGASRFRVLRWAPAYLRWYAYAFATTYLRRKAL